MIFSKTVEKKKFACSFLRNVQSMPKNCKYSTLFKTKKDDFDYDNDIPYLASVFGQTGLGK